MNRSTHWLLLCFLAMSSASAQAYEPLKCDNPPAHVILLRHGCKVPKTQGESLCSSGWAQAGELLHRLAASKIKIGAISIYTTTIPRSVETASVLALYQEPPKSGTQLAPDSKAFKTELESLCRKRATQGTTILYVGHSETIPDLFSLFGVKRSELVYGQGWVISYNDGKWVPEELPPSRIPCVPACAK